MLVFFGTYTRGPQEGIYVYRLNAGTGALEPTGWTAPAQNPSFLAIHPSRRTLYAVNELAGATDRAGGLSAFALEPETGKLSFLNQQPVHGNGPCYVSVDSTGHYAFVANYSSGSLSVLPIRADGTLGEVRQVVQHEGSSVDPKRQQGPHAHSILPDPENRFVLACDLGLDKVMVYRLDLEAGQLVPNEPPSASVPPGAGARHLAFHPNRRFVYVVNEMGSSVTVFAWDGRAGTLTPLQTLSTLPEGFAGSNTGADIHVEPSGRFLYASNRGHDSIAIFSIDAPTGILTALGHQPTGGQVPRNFGIDPTGTFLLAANQATDDVFVFRIQRETGSLVATGYVANVPKPVCVRFLHGCRVA